MSQSEPPIEDPSHAGILESLPLLRGLTDSVAELVTESFVSMEFAFGDEIVRQGEPADGFYVIVNGRARAIRDGPAGEVPLALLHQGDSFGEAGLLEGAPNSETVRASAATTVLRLDGALFGALVRRHPEVRERIYTESRARKLVPLLRGHPVFAALPGEALTSLAGELDEAQVLANEAVIREGDPAGPLFLVVEGRLRAWNLERGDLRYLRAGDLFGEVSLYTGSPRTATVEAVSDARLVSLSSEVYQRFASDFPELRARVADQLAIYARGPALNVPIDFAKDLLPEVQAALDNPESDPDRGSDLSSQPSRWAPRPRIGRRARHVPYVAQVDSSDCGPACLAMLCKAFGHPVPISFIRDACGTATAGTSLAGIIRGGRAIGLDVRAMKLSKDRLKEMQLPAIIHWRGDHWIVVDEVRSDRVHVSDPARGAHWKDRAELIDGWSGFTALVTPTDGLNAMPSEHANLSWLRPFFRPYRRQLILVAVLALIAATLQMLVPIMTGQIVNSVIGSRRYSRLYLLTGGLVALQLVALLASVIRSRVLARVALRIDAESLDHVAGRLLGLPLGYFESRSTTDVERRLDGLRQVRVFASHQGVQALTDLAQLLAAVVLMGTLSPLLMGLWLVTLPVYLGLLRLGTKRVLPAYRAEDEAFGRYRSRRMDAVRGVETVKSMGAEASLRQRMRADFESLAPRVVSADLAANDYDSLSAFITFVLLSLFLFAAALDVMAGHLSVGSLVAFNALALLAASPLLSLLGLWDRWQEMSVILTRMRDIIDRDPEQIDGDGALLPVVSLEGRLTLRNVGFRYATTPDTPLLEGIEIDVPPGTTVAIVGRSGSGKSTLLKCIAGLLDVTEGSVSFDSVDLRELRWVDLRRRIGLVPQRPYVFQDTIAANIAFGEPEPDMDAVRSAAEIAAADDFIQRLTLGYQTRIGESGMQLSGGQTQRIAIARAIYHRPPVLILDEATAALDSEAERAVTDNMRRLLEGRTAFVVSHRLSTVRDADLIIVLEQGRIAERGTHEDLLARGGLYFHLYGQQLTA